MRCLQVLLVATALLRAGLGSPLQSALQHVMDEKTAFYKQRGATGFQFSWKSGTEEFTIASGTAGTREMTKEDTFLFGSGVKPFTASLVMKRWEEGKLDLNATVAHYIDPLFKEKLGKTFVELFGPNATRMTVWHLMTMQSGIPDFDVPAFDSYMLWERGSDPTFTPLDIVQYAASQPWTCLPGECVYYTSTNYILLGYVLLAVAGKSIDAWESFDQRDVALLPKFADLHFVNSGPVSKFLTVPGFSADGGGKAIVNTSANILGWTCGNLAGTSRAMASWMWELLVARSIVGAKALELMADVRPISYGWGHPWLDYGAGLFVQQLDSRKLTRPVHYGDWGTTLGHGGDTYGFISDQGFIPQLNATFSWVGNSDGGLSNFDITCSIINAAAAVVLGIKEPFKCSSFQAPLRIQQHELIV